MNTGSAVDWVLDVIPRPTAVLEMVPDPTDLCCSVAKCHNDTLKAIQVGDSCKGILSKACIVE